MSAPLSDAAWALLMLIEGGGMLVRDAGGLTKWGISQNAYPDLDIISLSEADARRLANHDYWFLLRCPDLPLRFQFPVFDCAFNQGTGRAALLLQEALHVRQDGVIGPKTIAAAFSADEEALHRFNALRAKRYAAGDPASQFSWFKRISQSTWFAAFESIFNEERNPKTGAEQREASQSAGVGGAGQARKDVS